MRVDVAGGKHGAAAIGEGSWSVFGVNPVAGGGLGGGGLCSGRPGIDELMAGDGEIPEEAIDVGTPARDAGRSPCRSVPQG